MSTLVPIAPRRLQAILEADEPAALVEAMPVQDLYHLIKDTGIAEAADIIALATPEQVQGFLDLDAWDHEALDDRRVVPWLHALLDAPPERVAFVWRQLDQELGALIFQRWVKVYNIVEEEVPDDEEPPFVPTPDRFFMLKVKSDDPQIISLVERWVDRLYRADQELARHTIRAAASEPAAELEEMTRRWRNGRLEDLGFAPYLEALEVYRPLDASEVRVGERSAEPPAEVPFTLTLREAASRPSFVTQVLQAIDDDAELRRLEGALAVLLNKVLAADRVSPGDLELAAAGAAVGAATLSLGLETVARGDVARGVEALATVSLHRLHRVGVGILAKLKAAAETLSPRVDEPLFSVLAALRLRRPQLARAIDDPPQMGARPFGRLAEVRRVTDLLALAREQQDFVARVLKSDPQSFGPTATIGSLARTALLRASIGKPLEIAPVSPEDALRFIRGERQFTLAPPLREYERAIEGWMGDLEHAFRDVPPEEMPDRRTLAGFLIV